MTRDEAIANIGRPFRVEFFLVWFHQTQSYFDTIREVTEDGEIIGDIITASCDHCMLKQQQPEQLKNKTNVNSTAQKGN